MLKIDTSQLQQAAARIAAVASGLAGKDLEPVKKVISILGIRGVQRNFRTQKNADGTPWPRLKYRVGTPLVDKLGPDAEGHLGGHLGRSRRHHRRGLCDAGVQRDPQLRRAGRARPQDAHPATAIHVAQSRGSLGNRLGSPGIRHSAATGRMSDTTDFGQVEQDLMDRLARLKPATVAEIISASSESAADAAIKSWPAVVVILNTVRVIDLKSQQTGQGMFASTAQASWTLLHYANTGKQDPVGRYGPKRHPRCREGDAGPARGLHAARPGDRRAADVAGRIASRATSRLRLAQARRGLHAQSVYELERHLNRRWRCFTKW